MVKSLMILWMFGWLFEYDGDVDLGNATTNEVTQVTWMNWKQINELKVSTAANLSAEELGGNIFKNYRENVTSLVWGSF